MTETATKHAITHETKTETPAPKKAKPPDLQMLMLKRFLGELVTIYMINGIRLDGKLTGFDQYSITLDFTSLLYKHAISTILPARRLRHKDQETPT